VSAIIAGKNANKPHTVRYWLEGRQRERSFATAAEAAAFREQADRVTAYNRALRVEQGLYRDQLAPATRRRAIPIPVSGAIYVHRVRRPARPGPHRRRIHRPRRDR
jgi:hypothetical protein